MATIVLDPRQCVFYDPDGPNSPLVLQFPAIGGLPEGTRVKAQNITDSVTAVEYRTTDGAQIAAPNDPGNFNSPGWSVAANGILVEYMAVQGKWYLSSHGATRLSNAVGNNFVFAAYGGLELNTPTAGDDLGAGWDVIDQFDTVMFTTPRGFTQNLTNSSLATTIQGLYDIKVLISLLHNEAQSGRTTQIRLWNLTDSVQLGSAILVPIARNQPGSLISVTILAGLDATLKTKEIQLQMGNGDAVSAITYQTLRWSFNGAGQLVEPLDLITPLV